MSSMPRPTLLQPSVAFAVHRQPASSKDIEIASGYQAPVDAEWAPSTRGLGFTTGHFRGPNPSMCG